MALSQCIEDSPGCTFSKKGNDLNFQELYNERHRLALEELVSRGKNGFLDFLKKERIPNFLSDDEMQRITRTAKVPRCGSMHGEDPNFEQSASTSMDCSSVTYFPEISDIEPPLLEIGWPAFTAGSYRGVTRAVAHFQPSYGERIYSCKDAARRMIKSAREVIAIVTDSLTDLDVFKDLQEACVQRKVPVYVLLDQSSAPAFLQMCSSTNVRLDDLRLMRVRTITGTTYFMRSGAKITGKVHERFMLIDGNRAATGSYRFNWTDGKLNSSNLIELSGQVTEHFDEEFRILYAQSLPLSARAPPGAHDSSISHHQHHLLPLLRQPHAATTTPPASPARTGGPGTPLCLTSTPNHGARAPPPVLPALPGVPACRNSPPSESSTVADEWAAGGSPVGPSCQCHVSTQTDGLTVSSDTQTEWERRPDQPPPSPVLPAASRPPGSPMIRRPAGPSSRQGSSPASPAPVITGETAAAAGASLRERFHGLTQERRRHYTAIRTKLDRMANVLAQQRRELADVTNTARAQGGRLRARVGEPGQGEGMGTWPRARCVH